ncbi:MAG: hypothetical protein QNJ09_11740 [Paracoccaceae bacterium]|nr:hypothetical protein [Paracoccaceae bacterium]
MEVINYKELGQATMSSAIKVPRENVEYRLIAFEDGSRFPILFTSPAPIEVPAEGDNFEVRITGRTINGKIVLKDVILAHDGNNLIGITTVVLKP